MASYISMTINQRINYKANQFSKSVVFGTGMKNCIFIYKTAYECTGDKPHNEIRTYTRLPKQYKRK